MLQISACIEMLFRELPFGDRFKAAAEAGFQGVEFWGWTNKDLSAVKEGLAESALPLAACSIGTRDKETAAAFADGCLLKRENAPVFREIIAESIEVVRSLGGRTLIVTTGNTLPDVPRYVQHDAILTNLFAAAGLLEQAGVTLVLEPLNILCDHKGYYLSRSDEAFSILRTVDSPNIKLLFDVYHQQITEGFLTENIRGNIGSIGHFHIGDVPGRHQPGTGEIRYAHIFRAIAASGYKGYIGCEYTPAEGTDSLAASKAALELAAAVS